MPRGEIRFDALTVGRLVSAVACVLLKAYRLLISPLLGRNCRFEPSCSKFTEQVLAPLSEPLRPECWNQTLFREFLSISCRPFQPLNNGAAP